MTTKWIPFLVLSASLGAALTATNAIPGVRLVNSQNLPGQGRLEVFINNRWGTACLDNFDNIDAGVVCSSLGYRPAGIAVMSYFFYGVGEGPIHLDEVGCYGNESSILDCKRVPAEKVNCVHSSDVGIACLDVVETKIRLVGNELTPFQGRLEVFIGNQWGTVCDDDIDEITAGVICGQLGYHRSKAQVKGEAFFGSGEGHIFLDDLRCDRKDRDIFFCQHQVIGQSNCMHEEDVGIICYGGKQECQPQTTTYNGLNYSWPQTAIGAKASIPCSLNSKYNLTRKCVLYNANPLWEEVKINCDIGKELSELAKISFNKSSTKEVLTKLQNVSNKAEEYTPEDVSTSVSVLEKVLEVLNDTGADEDVSANIVSVISNVLDSSSNSLEKSESNHRILSIIDKVADTVNITNGTFEAVKPNLALIAVPITPEKFRGATLSAKLRPEESLTNENVELTDGPLSNSTEKTSYIALPDSLSSILSTEDKMKLDRITFALHTNGKLFKSTKMSDKEQQGLILSASVPGVTVSNLTTNLIKIVLEKTKFDRKAECVFWDDQQTPPVWSNRGCKTVDDINSSFVTCECDHLTNFALLLDVYSTKNNFTEENIQALSIISYIGCAISLVGLVITLTTLFMFRITKSNQYKILINFCFALVGNNIIFLIGQQEYAMQSENGCKAVAVIQHFFLLSCFIWTLVEAYSMYLALVKVFASYTSNFLAKACCVGWGTPVIIVIITLIVNLTNNYGRQDGDVCWLSRNAFYGSFLAVIALVLLLNTVAFVLVSRTLMSKSGIKSSKERDSTSTRLRRVASVMVLLGITWILGFLPAIGPGAVVVPYLFAVFNSLQGFYIFIFNVVLNKDASRKWKGVFKSCRKTKAYYFTSETGEGKSFTDSHSNTAASTTISNVSRA